VAELGDAVQIGSREDDLGGVDRIVSGIGRRVRDLRVRHGLSLQQLAERAGVSAAAIHKIERNTMVPTITTLLKLAEAFDRPVSYFVDRDASRPGPVAHIPAGERPRVFGSRPGVDVRAISGTAPELSLIGTVSTVAPGCDGVPLPSQAGREVLVLLLDGVLRFDVEGDGYELGVGDALHIRSDRPWSWTNPGDRPARAVWLTVRPSQSCPFAAEPSS
jgi:transcriptional regulator with XRE-family HTH domain